VVRLRPYSTLCAFSMIDHQCARFVERAVESKRNYLFSKLGISSSMLRTVANSYIYEDYHRTKLANPYLARLNWLI
jgi:hypothetical protein